MEQTGVSFYCPKCREQIEYPTLWCQPLREIAPSLTGEQFTEFATQQARSFHSEFCVESLPHIDDVYEAFCKCLRERIRLNASCSPLTDIEAGETEAFRVLREELERLGLELDWTDRSAG